MAGFRSLYHRDKYLWYRLWTQLIELFTGIV